MGKGIEGLIMKAWSAKNYSFTVTSTETITEKYVRVGFVSEGFFDHHPVHPTQWVRLWFDDGQGKQRQRGYTLVDANPTTSSFFVEFALHYGPASIWAENATAGDIIEASVLAKGSGSSTFALPEPEPSEIVVFGDTASLPAINSLLDVIGDIPTRVWLEWQYRSDPTLPVHTRSTVEITWFQRIDDGRLLREQADALTLQPDAFAWVACDGRTTRHIVKALGTGHSLPRDRIKAQAYWK